MNEVLTEPDTRFASIAVRRSYNSDWDGSIPAGAEMHPRGTGSHLIATTRRDDGTTDQRYVLHPFNGTFHRLRPHTGKLANRQKRITEYENLGWIRDLRNKLLEINPKCRECGERNANQIHHTVARAHDLELVLYNPNYMTVVCAQCHRGLEAKYGNTSAGKRGGLAKLTAYKSGMCHFLAHLGASNERIAEVMGMAVNTVADHILNRTSTGVEKKHWDTVSCSAAKARPPNNRKRRPRTPNQLLAIEAHRLSDSGLGKRQICEKIMGGHSAKNMDKTHNLLFWYDREGNCPRRENRGQK